MTKHTPIFGTRTAMRPGTSRAGPFLAIALALSACTPKPSEVALVIPVNPLCTTCNDFIRCDDSAAPGSVEPGGYVLYHLRAKSLGAQMATIMDFLLQAIREREEDLRPLTVYASTGGPPASGTDAITNLGQHLIAVPGHSINQATGQWLAADGRVSGQCRLLPVAEGRELARQLSRGTTP